MEMARVSKMNRLNVVPVVLCGGSGSRLWPLSRVGFPKQFLVFSGQLSLFQQAVNRLNNLNTNDFLLSETLIVTGEQHRFIVADQLRELSSISAKLILEPEGKNTAPALTLAALEAQKNGNDSILVVSPSDQSVKNLEGFETALRKGIELAANGSIVIFGIKPLSPETGFGYIKQKNIAGNFNEFEVDEFVEKPSVEKAKEYLNAGDYSWNSGMLVLRASVWLNALKYFRPDIEDATRQSLLKSTQDLSFIRPDPDLFKNIPSESIDYAVIEKCPQSEFSIKVMPIDVGWSDLGSWDSVWREADRDINQNLIRGDVLTNNTYSSYIQASHRLVSVVGLDNIAVIETPDAVLVTDLKQSQFIKEVVNQLDQQNREEHLLHRKVFRPWGWYDTIDVGDRFKVKRIQVNPGASLSLQKHSKRAEHWVVVRGSANVTCGERTITINENQSTFIPLGEMHRLSNPSDQPLEIIEVQSGAYLGEDDIVRINDGYGRR